MKNIKLLAIASGGGHWIQLWRVRPAWDGCRTVYVTTKSGYRDEVIRDSASRNQPTPKFYTVLDANRWQKFRLAGQLLKLIYIMVRERPNVIISTGAAPGYFAVRIGRFIGARTVWVDSIANAEELSLAGKMAGSYSDLWLTQWEDLSGSMDPEKGLPAFRGAVT